MRPGLQVDWKVQNDHCRLYFTPNATAKGLKRDAEVVVLRNAPFTIAEVLAMVPEEEADPEESTSAAERASTNLMREPFIHALSQVWPKEGARHEAALAVAGMLARRGVSEEEAVAILSEAAGKAGDEQQEDRVAAVRTTFEKHRAGEPTTGTPALCTMIGKARADLLDSFLSTPARRPAKDCLLALGPTDYSHTRRFIEICKDRVRFCIDQERWYLLDKNTILWRPTSKGQVLGLAIEVPRSYLERGGAAGDPVKAADRLKVVRNLLTPRRLQAIVDLAATQPEISISSDRFDANPFLLSVSNGVIDLKTGEFRERQPGDLCTKATTVVFDPKATAPRFLRFLDEVFKGDQDLIGFVQRFVGYAMTGETREHVVALLHGSGSNGKSTFIRVLRDLLGDYGANANRSTLARRKEQGGPRDDLARLAGKRMVTCQEMENDLDEGLLKELSGGDLVTARPLYAVSIEFLPQMKIVLTCNLLPQIHNPGEAIWRRLRVIPFMVRFSEAERDTRLDEKLRAEMSGILNWGLDGCRAWLADGLGDAGAVREATGAYQEQEDTLAAFVAERCETGAAYEYPRGEFYMSYTGYCSGLGVRPAPNKIVKALMQQQGFQPHKKNTGQYWRGLRPKEHPLEIDLPGDRE